MTSKGWFHTEITNTAKKLAFEDLSTSDLTNGANTLELEKEILETEIEVELPEIDGSEIFYESLEPLKKFSGDLLLEQSRVDLNSDLMVEIQTKKSKKLKYIYS